MRRNDPFTLIELVVVMTIAAVATGLAVSTFRNESPSRKLQRASLEFETFCAGVRYQAQEFGEDRIVYLDSAESSLVVKAPETEMEEDEEEDMEEEEKEKILFRDDDEEKIISRWKFPEDFSLDLEENEEDGELIELFRFFPDGGASGIRELTFSVKELKRSYRISPLTGQLSLVEVEE
jgi:prepilin-type N-terminal cleavage/methylation domain-containing protein